MPFHASMSVMDNIMGLPYRGFKYMANPAINKYGIRLTEGPGGMAPWVHGEHAYRSETGTDPLETFENTLFGEENKQNTQVQKPVENTSQTTQPVIDYGMPAIYQTPESKDTTIKMISPSGKIYETTTQNPAFKNVIVNLEKTNWDPGNQAFKLNPEDFKIGDNKVDVDEYMNLVFPKKAYGGMNEIPRLFKYSPERNIPGRLRYGGMPKLAGGGTPPNCEPGYMPDPQNPTKCISIEDLQYNTWNTNAKNAPTINNKFTSECPDGYVKDPMTFKCVPSMSASGMTGGFNWNTTSTDIHGNVAPGVALPKQTIKDEYGNLTTTGSIDMSLPTLYKTSDNAPKVGIYKCPKGFKKDIATGQCVPIPPKEKGAFSDSLYTKALNFDMYTNLASGISNNLQLLGKKKAADLSARMAGGPEALNVTSADEPGSRGNYNMQGIFGANDLGYKTQNIGEMGGTMLTDSDNKIKIRIKKSSPETMAYGGQSGYGFDLGQRNTYSAMTQGKMQTVSNSLESVPREYANIEAEKGETVYTDIDGDGVQEHMNIGGKRHVDGGTPLNVPEGSFIFSDTKKMTIKDPQVLSKFGMAPNKKGYTPAQIAKKYDVNKYKAILQDVNADQLMKNTAQLMMKNFQKKLAELALIQEDMKGFPQGIPEMCYGIIPDEILKQIEAAIGQQGGGSPRQPHAAPPQPNAPEPNGVQEYPQGQEPLEGTPQEQMAPEEELEPGMQMYGGEMAYGGYYSYGGNVYDEDEIPELAGGGAPPKNKWQEKIDKIRALNKTVAWSGRYKVGDTEIPTTQHSSGSYTGVFGDIATSDVADFKARHKWFFEKPENATWDPTNTADVEKFQKDYNARARSKGADFDFFDPSKRSGTMDALDGKFGEYTYNAPDLSDPDVPKDTTVQGYKCTGRDANNNPQVAGPEVFKDNAEMAAKGYVATMQEAYKQCPPDPGKPPGETPQKKPPTKVPFRYMTPDKWKVAAAASTIIPSDYPFIPDVAYKAGNFIPEEWRAKAAQLQGLAKQTGEQIGTFKGGNASVADITNLNAQAANQLVGAIADVDARNIAGVNAYNRAEDERRDKYNLLRASNAEKRAIGNAEVNRFVAGELNKKMMNVTDAAANAWTNRMKLGQINETNKFYYTDPTSGRTIFKGGYTAEDLGTKGTASTYKTSPDEFKQFQKDYMGADGKAPSYGEYIKWKEQISGTAKYGGTIKIRVRPSASYGRNDIAEMLSQGYGLPF